MLTIDDYAQQILDEFHAAVVRLDGITEAIEDLHLTIKAVNANLTKLVKVFEPRVVTGSGATNRHIEEWH